EQQQRSRALAQEMERQRLARSKYFPDGYDYEPESEEEDYYVSPRQRAQLEARRLQEALEQRRQEEARVLHERAIRQQEALRRSANTERTPPPQKASQPPSPPTPRIRPAPSPELAAAKIQSQYRIHRSLRASSSQPSTHDDGQNAKLAFTPTNVPLHTHMEMLSRLLVSLDSVESWGDRKVRERRRDVVRMVEGEAGRLEEFWRGVWAAHTQQQQLHDEAEVCTMVVEEAESEPRAATEGAAAPLPDLAAPESDSDAEPELPTPPATPRDASALVFLPESQDVPVNGGVVVDTMNKTRKL
ncbi:hypothetical protein B0H10DRAFT_1985046, partial [Mycena sp. CBHHK59/15]